MKCIYCKNEQEKKGFSIKDVEGRTLKEYNFECKTCNGKTTILSDYPFDTKEVKQ